MKIMTACAAVVATLGLAACGTEAIPQDEVEAQAAQAIEEEVGTAPKSVSCPGDLDAEVGKTMKCTLTAPDDSELDVTVEVRSKDGDTARFSVEVGNEVRR